MINVALGNIQDVWKNISQPTTRQKVPTEYKTEGQSTNQAMLEKRIILATRGMGEKNIPECDKR